VGPSVTSLRPSSPVVPPPTRPLSPPVPSGLQVTGPLVSPVFSPDSVFSLLQRLDSGDAPPAVSLSDRWAHFPIAGRLRHFYLVWAVLVNSAVCNSIVTQGVVPDLVTQPRYRPARDRPIPPEHVQPMREKIATLLQQQIIQPVGGHLRASFNAFQSALPSVTAWVAPPLNSFFHDYFLVPKPDAADGSACWRDILNAKPYNLHVRQETFKMEGIKTLQSLCRPGDFYCSMDVSSAYPHLFMHTAYWKQFRIRVPDPVTGHQTDYEYTSLPFGLCSAPRLYSLLSKNVAAYLRSTFAIRVIFYLDDWLILGSSYDECARHSAIVATFLQCLGFVLNAKKSAQLWGPDGLVNPIQHGGLFLGLELDLRPEFMLLRLPTAKRRGLRRSLKQWLSACSSSDFCFSPRSLAQLVGKMISTKAAVKGAMSHSRTLSRLLKIVKRRHSWDDLCVRLSGLSNLSEIVSDLQWWWDTLAKPTANDIKMSHADCSVDTDASPWAWGGFLHGIPCGGFWDANERQWSSNRKEMTGIFRALTYFAAELTGKTVLVQTDNATCVSYLRDEIRSGRVDILSRLALRIWTWCSQHSVTIRCVHLPGKLNTRADLRSRVSQHSRAEAMLNPVFLPQLERRLGHRLTVDLFATRANNLLPRFFCLEIDPLSSGRDAFLQPWDQELRPLAHPPFRLIARVLEKVRRDQCTLTLIAPVWGAAWFPDLMSMCVAPPIMLPRLPSLFLGTDSTTPVPLPRWDTAVFRLCGRTSSPKVSRTQPFLPW